MFVEIHKNSPLIIKLGAHLCLYLTGRRKKEKVPRNLSEPQTRLDRSRTVRLRTLMIRLLESNKAHLLVALMQKETHALSSDLETEMLDQ